jgi:hypothetical protein
MNATTFFFGMLIVLFTVKLNPSSFGGDERGRSSIARRRIGGECSSSIQAQSSSRGHYQGDEASLLLPEAGR